MSIRTIVYVDAFNLYYGALKDKPYNYKWLDLLALSRAMLRRGNDIVGIKYFTAKVVPRRSSPMPEASLKKASAALAGGAAPGRRSYWGEQISRRW